MVQSVSDTPLSECTECGVLQALPDIPTIVPWCNISSSNSVVSFLYDIILSVLFRIKVYIASIAFP